MPDTQDLVEGANIAGGRPYTLDGERASSVAPPSGPRRRSEPPEPQPVTPGNMNFAPEVGYETPLLGGVMRGMDFINRGISGAVGAVPGEAKPLPVLADTGPTDRTGADEWFPAIARRVIDGFAMSASAGVVTGLRAGSVKPDQQVSLQEAHARERVTELRGQYEGITEKDAATIARLEDVYNTLGGTLLAGTAALLGFTGAGIAVGATATAAVVAGGVLADEEQVERGEKRLPEDSIGREVASLAVPEAAVLQPLRFAVNAIRLRTAAHLVVGGADDALDAAKASVSDLQAVARVADEQAARAPDAATSRAAAEVRDEAEREADAIRRTVGITPPTAAESAAADVQSFLRQAQPEEPTVGDELMRAYERAELRIGRVLARMTPSYGATTGAKVKVSRTGRTLVNEVEQVIADLQAASDRYGVPLPAGPFDALLRLRDEVRAEEIGVAGRNVAVNQGKKLARDEIRAAKTEHGKAETAAVNTKLAAERAGGESVTFDAYRGSTPSRAAAADGSAFYAKDEAVAKGYAGADGAVVKETVTFTNAVRAENWMELKDALGLPRSTTMPDLITAAREAGYDGIVFNKTVNGTEYVRTGLEGARAGAVGKAQQRVGEVYEREELGALRQRARQIADAAEDVDDAGEGIARVERRSDQAADAASQAHDREAISIVARADREKERLSVAAVRNEGRLAAVRERTDRFLSTKRQKTTVDGIDMEGVRTGYVRPDDQAVLAKTLVHTGKHDSETFGRWMREFVEANPEKVARAEAMTTQDIANQAAVVGTKTGIDPVRFTASLPRRGDVAARLYLGDIVLSAKTREWAELGQAVAHGEGSAADLAKMTEDLAAFTNSLTEGVSEIGRALWSRKLIAKDRTAALVRTDAEVKRTEGTLRKAAARLAATDAQVAAVRKEVEAAQRGVEDRAAAEVASIEERRAGAAAIAAAKLDPERAAAIASRDEAEVRLVALTSDRVAFTESSRLRIAAAETRVDEAIQAHEDALAAHEAALSRAAEAYSKVREAIVRNAPKMQLTADDLVILAQMESTNTTALLNWLKQVRQPKPLAWVQAFLSNSMYGSVVSLQQNVLNTLSSTLLDELIEPLMRVTSGKIASRIVGEQLFAPARVEQTARMLGALDAIPDAFRGAFNTQVVGDDIIRELRWGVQTAGVEAVEPISGLARKSAVPGKRGLVVEGALRQLRASDLFFRLWTTGGESRALLMRETWLQGGDDAVKVLRAGEALSGLKNGQDKYVRVAARSSAARTFNDELASDSNRRRFLNFIGADWKGLRTGLIVIPAARFGFSWQRVALESLGAGYVTGARRAIAARKLEGVEQIAEGREAARAMNRAVVGSATLLMGTWAYSTGVLTGAYPTDAVERDRWKVQGKQAVSFRVGEFSIPLALLPPVIGMPLTLVAMLGDQLAKDPDPDRAEWEDRSERVAAVLGQWAGDIPAFRGMSEILGVMAATAVEQTGAAFDRWVAAKVSLAQPWRATTRSTVPAFDETRRAPQGIGQNIQAGIPAPFGALGIPTSADLPAERGGLGEPLPRPVSGAVALTALQPSQPKPLDDVYALLAELGVRYTGTGETIGESRPGQPIKLTREEAEHYQEIAGPLVKEGITYLRTTKEFTTQKDPLIRQALAKNMIAKATKEGRKRFTAEAVERSLDSGDEATIVRAVQMYRSQVDVKTLGKLTRYLVGNGRMTESMARVLDETRPVTTDGRAPTIAQLYGKGR